jgi:hypothetical protein
MAEIWVNSKIRCWSDEAKRKRDESIENANLSLSFDRFASLLGH